MSRSGETENIETFSIPAGSVTTIELFFPLLRSRFDTFGTSSEARARKQGRHSYLSATVKLRVLDEDCDV